MATFRNSDILLILKTGLNDVDALL